MGFVISLLLIGVGAILTWAVTDNSDSINLDAVGVILMVVGLLSFVLTLFLWESWWGVGAVRRGRYAEGDAYARRSSYGPRRRGYVVEEEETPAAPPGPPPP